MPMFSASAGCDVPFTVCSEAEDVVVREEVEHVASMQSSQLALHVSINSKTCFFCLILTLFYLLETVE